MNRAIAISLLLAVSAADLRAEEQENPHRVMGKTLAEAQKSDFFTFFHLEQVEEQGPLRVFKPKGGSFRKLVAVSVMLDQDDKIFDVTLHIVREFVDHPKAGVFARDLAKSMLLASLPAQDLPKQARLIKDIWERTESDKPSNAYAAFLGQGKDFEQRMGKSIIMLENEQNPDEVGVLTIAVTLIK